MYIKFCKLYFAVRFPAVKQSKMSQCKCGDDEELVYVVWSRAGSSSW